MDKKIGAVLVAGGGIAGIQASLDLAESGFKVYLVEKNPSIGGHMPQLDKTFPTNDCAMCILAPKLVEAGRHPNIELITYAELKEIRGRPGDFKAIVYKRPRYVDIARCIGCGVCSQMCPVEVDDTYNERLSKRKAIYIEYPQAVPLSYVIDEGYCQMLTKGKCGICKKFCKAGAIDHQMKGELIELDVGSIILAPGFDKFDPKLKHEYGYGRYKNVITSLEFERILSASGPFQGHLQRLSDAKEPERIAWIQCVGSRDCQVKNEYCSSVCCTYAIKEAIIAKEHVKNGLEATIFYMDLRTYGKGFETYYNRARNEYGVEFIRGRVAKIKEVDSKDLVLYYIDETGKICKREFDLVVLSIGFRPKREMELIAEELKVEINDFGFLETKEFNPCQSSRMGIFVAGTIQSPKDIPETVAQASGAACEAGGILIEARRSLVTRREYPPEVDVTLQEPRIGVFICHCGINIASVIDVNSVEEYVKSLPGVVYSQRNLFTCSEDTQERIKEVIKEYKLNRVVVAACSPRTHEPLFQQTLREAGLNPYLFEMANIRDQCSWVHMDWSERATEKAKILIRMAIAKVSLQEPLLRQSFPVIKKCLVIGGGLVGMTSSLALAEQGIEVYLVEREKELGGNLKRIYYTLKGEDTQVLLSSMIKKVENHPMIKVYKSATILDVSGYVGNFKSRIQNLESRIELEHGVIIVATGAEEYKPTEYLYGQDPRVITQRELEERLATHRLPLTSHQSVVMIQCVGSREENRPYCSRVCCQQAIKNALRLKELNKRIEVFVLYRDIRTYGLMEKFYTKARELGVIFIRYEEKPEANCNLQSLEVKVFDPILRKELVLNPDLVVLSTAIIPSLGNDILSKMLKVTLDEDGFFLEAHPKLRPIDSASEGIFLAGLCHSPKLIEESISQALGAAGRAVTILSKDELEAEGVVSVVDPDKCATCLTCIRVCPYGVPFINDEGVAEIEAVKCHGCGICTGECPARAIQLMNYKDDQILAKIGVLNEKNLK